jgi:hypothetical protein
LRSSALHHLEASQTRVSQSGLKTGADAVWMVHMVALWRLRRVEVEDGWVDATGCIKPFYPNFIVFYVLGTRGILVFYLVL